MRLSKFTQAFVAACLFVTISNCKSNPPSYSVIVVDRSDSINAIKAHVLGLAEYMALSRRPSKKPTVTIIATGDATTSMEPIFLGEIFLSKRRKISEGKEKDNSVDPFVENVSRLLEKTATQMDATPLYLAIRRSVQILHSKGCGKDSSLDSPICRMFIVSDGEETEEKAIRSAIRQNDGKKLPPAMILNNNGVEVLFCGIANTNELTQVRNYVNVERLETVWRKLFEIPEHVSFAPYCPTPPKEESANEAL